MDLLVAKCSRKSKIDMPIFNAAASPAKETAEDAILSNTITPPPNAGDTQVWAFHEKKKGKVTPSPGTALTKGKAKSAKPSKKLVEMHKKWQEEATKLGGPEARIVVSKPEAKKMIFDLLHDAFAPMNITQIYQVRHWRDPLRLSMCLSHLIDCISEIICTETEGGRSITHLETVPRRHGSGQDGQRLRRQ